MAHTGAGFSRQFTWFLALSIAFLAAASLAAARTWNDATGKFQIEAELIASDGGKVRLRKADGARKSSCRSSG